MIPSKAHIYPYRSSAIHHLRLLEGSPDQDILLEQGTLKQGIIPTPLDPVFTKQFVEASR